MREVAAEERLDQDVGPRERLDPYTLADTHGIDIYAVDELPGEHCSYVAVEHFTSARRAAWSAALVPIGSARIILENVSHDPRRRRSSIAHELGHFLLEHGFDEVLLTDGGRRHS
jgi:IrrE N-terminal-like domain